MQDDLILEFRIPWSHVSDFFKLFIGMGDMVVSQT